MRRAGRATRTLLLAVPAASLFLSSACRSYQPVHAGTPAPTEAVRVRFAAPRDLRAVSQAGDTVTLGGVTTLSGHVESERGDTLALRVGSATGVSTSAAAGSRLTVVRTAGDHTDARAYSGRRTAALIASLGAVALVAILIAALDDFEEDLGGIPPGY
jgi:hypothetical protein